MQKHTKNLLIFFHYLKGCIKTEFGLGLGFVLGLGLGLGSAKDLRQNIGNDC